MEHTTCIIGRDFGTSDPNPIRRRMKSHKFIQISQPKFELLWSVLGSMNVFLVISFRICWSTSDPNPNPNPIQKSHTIDTSRAYPKRYFFGYRKLCNRWFFCQNSQFLGLKVISCTMWSRKGRIVFWEMFRPHLVPKQILGCNEHPEGKFRTSESSAKKMVLKQNNNFQGVLQV